MVIGYLAIFIPMVAVSAYAISQLTLFHRVTGQILEADHRMRDYEKKIDDSLLAQVRYERKYFITKDRELLNQFLIAESDLMEYIDEALSAADTANKTEAIIRVKTFYERYRSLFHEEVKAAGGSPDKDEEWFRQKRKEQVDEILWELRDLRSLIQEDTYAGMVRLGDSAARANWLAMATGAGFLFSGMVISILITRSITRPLSSMREKTRQIASGVFEGNLDIPSPPEIRDLARDFNLMCDKLKETDRMKSDFFSLMAHELRTPLTSIKEGTSLLIEGIGEEIKERGKAVLAIMAEESNRMIDLVNSLLDLSKMEAGMMSLNLEISDIRPLIDIAVSGMRPLAMAKNMSIEVEMPHDLPPLRMDRERILQAIRNLTGNALKFTPAGGRIAISARFVKEGVTVSVADSGPGIPRQDANAIFDKFKQTTITSYRKIKGTGLGLAIVKRIVNAHGGRVWVESETGQGSVFFFLLPV
jgi:two-component system sensor histidine kinase GlrK